MSDFDFGDKIDPVVEENVNALRNKVIADEKSLTDILTDDAFRDPDFYYGLEKLCKGNKERMYDYYKNTSAFHSILSHERERKDGLGLFGEVVEAPDVAHADGKKRRREEGRIMNTEFLNTRGIDANFILFFRLTEDSSTPKPEYYWTSDYSQAQRGLHAEISREQRERSVILVSNLALINNNRGLIEDINDDNGLSVRQLGTQSFPESSVLIRLGVN